MCAFTATVPGQCPPPAHRRAIVDKARTIRVPNYVYDLMQKWKKATRDLLDELGTMPSDEQVGDRLEIPRKRLKKLLLYMERAKTKQMASDDEGVSPVLQEAVDPIGDPADEAMKREIIAKAQRGVDALDDREATIIRMRFGLENGGETATLKEIGEVLSLTRERVRQIEQEALAKLLQYVETAQQPAETDDACEAISA